MKLLPVLLILVSFAMIGCADRPPALGLPDWPAVMRVTEDMMLRHDSSTFLRHVDTSHLTAKTWRDGKEMLEKWQGMPPTMQLDRVEVVAATDFVPREGVPEELARQMGTPRWSRPPEKVIVYRYASSDRSSSARWFFGVFQENGHWYFSAYYIE